MSDAAPRSGEARQTPLRTSAHATVHCLIGCMIGETAGLAIGVSVGLGAVSTVLLAVALAYVSGFTLALIPVMRDQGLSLAAAMSVVWLGEAVSISAMEIAMNLADWLVGGLAASSLADPRFWIGLAVAAPAGFLAGWPVNHWLLKRRLKACH